MLTEQESKSNIEYKPDKIQTFKKHLVMATKPELINGRAFQYQFDLIIEKVSMQKHGRIPTPSYMEVVWGRKMNKITTKNKVNLKGDEEEIYFGEKLSMISTCYLNPETKAFQAKESEVDLVINIDGKMKLCGRLPLNICTALNPNNYKECYGKTIEEQMKGTKIKTKIFLRLLPTYLKEMQKADQNSVGSGIGSNTTLINNLSNYSITEQGKDRYGGEKKYEIPSKDTYSVMSYGGGIRYSAKKEDTASIKQEEGRKPEEYSKDYGNGYGYYNRDNYFNRTMNEYNLNNRIPSNASSTSKQVRNNSESDHNKSNFLGDQNSRLLVEEQTKRSKLEAEITRSKVEINELKSKLSEYLHENMKLKEDVHKKSENNDTKTAQIREESDELKKRNYVLSNQVKELKICLEKYISFEKENSSLKSQRQMLNKQLTQYKDTILQSQRQSENHSSQLHILRTSQEKLMKQLQELQYFSKSNEEHIRKQYQQKIYELTTELKSTQSQDTSKDYQLQEHMRKLSDYEIELSSKNNRILNLEEENREMERNKIKEYEQLKNLYDEKKNECDYLKTEINRMKGDVARIKDEKTAEYEQKINAIAMENLRVKGSMKTLDEKINTLTRQKQELSLKIRAETEKTNKEVQRLKLFESKYNQQIISNDRENTHYKNVINSLEQQARQLKEQLEIRERQLHNITHYSNENEQLMKQNLQLELDLKYRHDELERLRNIEEEFAETSYKYGLQQKNIKELEENVQKMEKQLKEKNRSERIESERIKIITQERNTLLKNFGKVKQELESAENIIFNGDRQVQEMDRIIMELDMKNQDLLKQNRELRENKNRVTIQKYETQILTFEKKVKELQARNIEKLKTIQGLNNNISQAYKQIKGLQEISEQRKHELLVKESTLDDLDKKYKTMEDERQKYEQELQQIRKQSKQSSKRNDMLKDELYIYKKKLQEEKGRSHSTLQIRSSEDFIKMKNMENDIQKKDEKIRKLQKELMTLEDENVKQSIEFMKKFQDLKSKLSSQT